MKRTWETDRPYSDHVTQLVGREHTTRVVGTVPKGAIVVLDAEVFDWTDDPDDAHREILDDMREVAGHDQFLVIVASAGTDPISVFDPVEANRRLATLAGTPEPLVLCEAIDWLMNAVNVAAAGSALLPAPERIVATIEAARARVGVE